MKIETAVVIRRIVTGGEAIFPNRSGVPVSPSENRGQFLRSLVLPLRAARLRREFHTIVRGETEEVCVEVRIEIIAAPPLDHATEPPAFGSAAGCMMLRAGPPAIPPRCEMGLCRSIGSAPPGIERCASAERKAEKEGAADAQEAWDREGADCWLHGSYFLGGLFRKSRISDSPPRNAIIKQWSWCCRMAATHSFCVITFHAPDGGSCTPKSVAWNS